MNAEVIIFACKDDPGYGFEQAKRLARVLEPTGAKVRFVHKLSFDLDELRLVAKHKIVTTPAVIVQSGDATIYRKAGKVPSEQEVRAVLCAKERRDEQKERNECEKRKQAEAMKAAKEKKSRKRRSAS